jgi:hypothetical protein
VADPSDTLSGRVEELVRPPQRLDPIQSTTGTRAAVASLLARTQALEEAVRELEETVRAITEAHRQVSVGH